MNSYQVDEITAAREATADLEAPSPDNEPVAEDLHEFGESPSTAAERIPAGTSQDETDGWASGLFQEDDFEDDAHDLDESAFPVADDILTGLAALTTDLWTVDRSEFSDDELHLVRTYIREVVASLTAVEAACASEQREWEQLYRALGERLSGRRPRRLNQALTELNYPGTVGNAAASTNCGRRRH